MICIFKNTAKKKQLIETNGEYVLDNICTYGMITEGLNDEFTLEIEFEILAPIKKEIYDLIIEEGILKVEDEYGDEFFVINEIYKTSDSIRAIARQITIAETLDLFLEDVRPEKQNGAGALTHIFSNTTCTHEIVVNSDISTISTAYYNRKTVYEALHDADMSFQERWGGEVYRRQFNLHINNKVGSYRGVKIKSNKNLTGFEENTTKDTVCTRIYPKGFNGITIEEKYIDSENIGMYKRPISRVYTFEDVKVRGENTGEDEEVFETLEEAQEELKKRAKALFEEDKVDLIKAYYTINHVDLRATEEYKNYAATEMTCIGDEVDVEEETLGIDIRTRVVKRKYNILTKEREETELSNVGLKRVITLPDLEKEIEKIPNTESFLEAAKEIATGLINAGIKNSHVVVRKNEILIMDSDDINTAQKVWRFNVNGLGYSSTGYHGEFGLAMTMDGSIVADFINVGILNANLIKAGVLKSFNNKTWINMEDGTFNFSDNLLFDGKTTIYRGALKVEGENGKFAMLEPFGKDGEIQFRMTLAGEGIDSNFNVIDGTGKELFRVGHGGVGLHNNITFTTDQTGAHNGDCYWQNGTYYPANDWKNIIGKNSNAFYKVFGYKFGLDRTGTERYADFEGPIFRLISSWGYGGLAGDNNGYFFPEQNNAWSFGKSDKRISTVYCTNINQPSDLKLKENVKYLLRDEVQTLSLDPEGNNSDITTQDCYDFIKNDLKLAQFNYKLLEEKESEKIENIGFIAQDIQGTKIGNVLLSKDENNILSYDNATYIGILASALQKAIDKIDFLESKIEELDGGK